MAKINTDTQQSLSQLRKENIQYGSDAEDCRKAKEAYQAKGAALIRHWKRTETPWKRSGGKIARSLETFKDAGIYK